MLEIYSDYLISSFGQTSATVLSRLLDGKVSHDQITRFLDQGQPLSKAVWQLAKPLVRRIEQDDGVVSVDDSVEEKAHSAENGVIAWHYDHTTGRVVKGLNFITAFYSVRETAPGGQRLDGQRLDGQRLGVPLGCEVIVKENVWDDKKGMTVAKSLTLKNEHYRELLRNVKANGVKYKYVLNDTWYTNAENMNFVAEYLEKKFVMAIKENLIVMRCDADDIVRWKGPIRDLPFAAGQVCEVYIRGVDFPVYITKHVFKNKNGTTGTLYLCTNDIDLTAEEACEVYQERWPIEEYHKSLKQNASFARCPASRRSSQMKHILCSLYGYIKLEWMKLTSKKNHFALRSSMYLAALRASHSKLQQLSRKSQKALDVTA